jgi:alkylhydroperoxidase/carboxymuconolactone decarboxylase family protein YurZ
MPHIKLPEGLPGIRSAMAFRPATAKPLNELAEILLHLNDDEELVKRVKADFQHADVSPRLKALLVIATKVQKGGKHVTAEDVEEARAQGATDVEIHDTVLIAAAFCMYNRYVDGLATWQPREEELYRERGRKTAREGYVAVSKEYIPQNGHEGHVA